MHANIDKFLPFLEDLRHRLYRGVLLFIGAFVVGFLSTTVVLGKVLSYVRLSEVTLTVSSPFQFVDVAMDFGFFLAIIVCAPYVIYSFYAFIVPALTKEERRKLIMSTPLSIFLFLSGFAYGFFILYYALEVLASVNIGLGIANYWNISQFFSQMFVTSALLGVVFEFPLLLTLLIKMGIITTEMLQKQRRIAYFAIFSMTAVLPPTDGLSLLAMTLPLVLLYEVTILVNNKKQYVWTRT